jgi:hypothetical protein
VFSYKLQPTPSTLRVRAWRNLKAMGAMYIQQSVCVIPNLPQIREKIQQLKTLFESNQGEYFLLEVTDFTDKTSAEMLEAFNNQRKTECMEFIDSCNQFLLEIKMETQKCNYAFHEVEENEESIERLKRWLHNIQGRDFFESDAVREAGEMLARCEEVLSEFTKSVYLAEGCQEG